MSAFGGKADMTVHLTPSRATVRIATMSCQSLEGDNEATRLLHGCGLSGRVAACCARAAIGERMRRIGVLMAYAANDWEKF